MAEEDNVTFVEGEAEIKMEDQSENKQDTDANGGAASTNMEVNELFRYQKHSCGKGFVNKIMPNFN